MRETGVQVTMPCIEMPDESLEMAESLTRGERELLRSGKQEGYQIAFAQNRRISDAGLRRLAPAIADTRARSRQS